jgi:uncharacterized membrane protein
MSLRTRERTTKIVLRSLSLAAVVVGILILAGVQPLDSRTIEVVVGTASLMAGLALWGLTMRLKSVIEIDNS